ncbi:hypothetical protein DWF00_23875 [Bosea caraganae]|uniref:Uncharacterized protein n=1 Tax=Bosea caraganae TaxID=2763117 RepID=A0A370L1V8_9HYPH|nr:hypothetical protein DWE98_19670 [Bosea caraganae]RDJ22791.1 hypothetical protein DWF00_23875 [Bosea caraganae]
MFCEGVEQIRSIHWLAVFAYDLQSRFDYDLLGGIFRARPRRILPGIGHMHAIHSDTGRHTASEFNPIVQEFIDAGHFATNLLKPLL